MKNATRITRRGFGVLVMAGAAAATLSPAGPAAAGRRSERRKRMAALAEVSILDYESLVPNRDEPRADWDWTAAVQTAVAENQGNVIVFPNEGARYLVSGQVQLLAHTTLRGDQHSRIHLVGSPPDGAFLYLHEDAVIQNPTTAFSHDIGVYDLEFQTETHQRQPVIRLINVRGAEVDNCRFINCGGLVTNHELMVNGSYDKSNLGASGDPAVEAGFSATDTDDLCEDVTFTNNLVDGQQYYVQGIRLNWTNGATITGNTCRYANISWWGGSARKPEGGTKANLRRCVNFTITDNYCSWANGLIYGNCGTDLTIRDNECEYAIDTGIDMEGCTDYLIEHNTVRYAGNFCYSVFYASDSGVFRDNTAVQGSAAAGLNALVGETKYGPNLGKEVFRQIASFNDDGVPEQFTVENNDFQWEDDTGFGALRLNQYGKVTIRDNLFTNVAVDTRLQRLKYRHTISDNRLRFTNPSKAGDVYVAIGKQRDDETVVFTGNTVNVTNPHQDAIPLVIHHIAASTSSSIIGNTIEADTTIAIGYGDVRDAPHANDVQHYEFTDNRIQGGRAIKNIGTNDADTTTVSESGNVDFAGRPIAVDTVREPRSDLNFGVTIG